MAIIQVKVYCTNSTNYFIIQHVIAKLIAKMDSPYPKTLIGIARYSGIFSKWSQMTNFNSNIDSSHPNSEKSVFESKFATPFRSNVYEDEDPV